MTVLAAAASYFASVFGAGFVFGVIRTLWIAPWLGTRVAELLEMPLMLVVIVVASRWVVRRFALFARGARAAVGAIALMLLLAAELALVLPLRGISISEYVGSRDPVSGTAYLAMLLVFALAPSWGHAPPPKTS